jgi:uncharacterized membrane protein YbhN (UPF0104 family)
MKKTILTVLQLFVTLGILVWMFHDPEKRAKMWDALLHAKLAWLLAGVGSYGIVELLAAVRWYLLLRVQGVNLAPWRVGALLMLGIFFNTFMPGATGGDVLKTYFLFKTLPNKKAEGLLAVLMDRLIGLTGLIVISSIIISIQYHWLTSSPVPRHLTWVLLLILVSSLGGIAFSFVVSGFGLAHQLPARMPMRDKLIDLAVAYNAYGRAWPSSLAALMASFGVHLASFSVFLCAARALDLPISPGALLTVMPIILTLASIPISVGGNGVREGLFAMLLMPLCGLTQPQSVTLSITGAMLTWVWALVGGVIYLIYVSSDHTKLSDVERQVHALEHEIAEHEEEAEPGARK